MAENKIIMAPMPIGSLSLQNLSNPEFTAIINDTRFWVTENARTFRRFIAGFSKGIKIDDLMIFELTRDFSRNELEHFLKNSILSGNIGVVSEAGIPGMADPGAEIAMWGHLNGIPVVAIPGPGSIYLALAASGLNGQHFTFHGYPPMKEPELKAFIQQCEKLAKQTSYTQMFIETPYRSDRMFDFLLKYLSADTLLSISCNLQEPGSYSKTASVQSWRTHSSKPGKWPCLFLIGYPQKGQKKNSSF